MLKKKIKNQQLRRWCFTLNNPTDEEHEELICAQTMYTYLIIAREVGDKGTPHLQGYMRCSRPTRLSEIKKISPRAHWTACSGSDRDNRIYCKKGLQPKEEWLEFKSAGRNYGINASFEEYGNIGNQGARTDLEQIKHLARTGAPRKEIWDACSSLQQYKFAEVGGDLYSPVRNWKPHVSWFWGKTGSGKTAAAVARFAGSEYWMSGRNLKWWDGYEGHDNVIIDDFRADFCTFHELLRILDRYPYRVEVKGSSRQLLARNIIITCPWEPANAYAEREDIDQLIRRIDEIRLFQSAPSSSSLSSSSSVNCVTVTEVGGNTTECNTPVNSPQLSLSRSDNVASSNINYDDLLEDLYRSC